MWGLEAWNRGTKKDLACTIGGDLQSSFTATPGKWEMTMKSSGGGRKKSLVTTYVARKGPKVRGPDKKNSGCWKDGQREWKNNRSKSMCPSMGDKDSSVCGGYFHYVRTKSLKSPRVIRDWLSSLQWEQRICVWGHYKHSVWALNSKSLCSGHTLSPPHSAIPLFSPLRAMETRRLSLSALSCSVFFSLSLPTYHPIFVFTTLVLTALGLIRTGRVRRLLNWASRWLSRSLVCVSVCVWVSVCATHGCFSANEVNSVERK